VSTSTPARRLRAALRRLWPKRVRTRLTLLYTSLFLAGGVVLLGLTFALVSNSLHAGSNAPQPGPSPGVLQACKQEASARSPAGKPPSVKGQPPLPASKLDAITAECKKVFQEGAAVAVANQRDHTMHELEVYSWLGLGVITVVSAGLGWLVAGRVLRPVHDITAAAQRASERHLGERLNLQGPDDELKELADTFDAMLDRLDLAFAAQRQFVANASHELRTPLTSMRTAIDVVLAKPNRTAEQLESMAEKVRRSIDRAERIIDALLTLAVSSRGLDAAEPLDLATAAEDALDGVRDVARGAGLTVESDLSPAGVEGSRVLLDRLVGNLVQNAVGHNVQEGWLRLRTGTSDGHAFLEVSNSGPVVDPDLVPHLFEPFRRADVRTASGVGVGLGLSIVKSVAEAHHGVVEAAAPAEGGLVVTLTLPASAEGRAGAVRRADDPSDVLPQHI
jgi:signal transduction histidine kinase